MKNKKLIKILALTVLAAAVILLAGCTGGQDEESTGGNPVVTDSATATGEPVSTETPVSTDGTTEENGFEITEAGIAKGQVIGHYFGGTYTAASDDFVYIFENDGKGYMMFDNWSNVISAGDSYAEPESLLIADAANYNDEDNKSLITLLAEDGSYTEYLLDLTTSDVVVLCPAGGETSAYYYIVARQYPPKTEEMTMAQLYTIVEGLWKEYNEKDMFLDFYESSGTYILEWGKLSEYNDRGSMMIQAAEYNELTEKIYVHGVIAGQFEDKKVDFVLTEAWGGEILEESGLFDSDTRSFLSSAYNEENPIGDALSDLLGIWTAATGDFITISQDGDDYYIVLAVWNAGGPFPRGKVTGAELQPSEVPIYELTVSYDEDGTAKTGTARLTVDRHGIEFTNWYGQTHIYYKGDMLKSYEFMEFLSYFERYWFNSDGYSVLFYADSGELYVELGKEEDVIINTLRTFRIDSLELMPSEVLIYELQMYESSSGTRTQTISIIPGGALEFIDGDLNPANYTRS